MRFKELVLEFAPPVPPEQQVGSEPTTTNPQPIKPSVVQPITTVGAQGPQNSKVEQLEDKLQELVDDAQELPEGNSARQMLVKLLQKLAGAPTNEQTGNDPLSNEEAVQNLIHTVIERLQNRPDLIDRLMKGELHSIEVALDIAKDSEVKKSSKAAIATIELNKEGEIVKMDHELEQYAQKIAKKLNMNIKWTRNLIGMFGMSIPRTDKIEFLKACSEGKALDLPRMMKEKHGKLEDFITKNPPSIQQVFDSIKHTLLDISLSTGQGAATGPFEAMLAIMGGAQKAPTGDLLINGKKFEVKSSSISVGEKGQKNSNAWLDATGEVAPAKVREKFTDLVNKLNPNLKRSKTFSIAKADFRPGGLWDLAELIDKMGPNGRVLMAKLHEDMFPSVAKLRGKDYNFLAAINRITDAILEEDGDTIAKEQGIMAMLEYAIGKYESGFILYNSSFQTFRIVETPQDIIALLKNPAEYGITFERSKTVTMGSGRKSSPGIYFGPLFTSPEGKAYTKQMKSSPEWLQKYQKGIVANKKEAEEYGDTYNI